MGFIVKTNISMEKEPLNEKEILQSVADTITDKGTVIEIDVKAQNRLERFLMKIGWAPTKRTFHLKPLVVGNMYRIAGKTLNIPDDLFSGGLIQGLMQGIGHHTKDLAYIVATGIQNNKKEPTKALIEFVEYNCTMEDIYTILNAVLNKMDVENFLNSIALIKGADALRQKEQTEKASPMK